MCVCANEEAAEKLLAKLLGVVAKFGCKWMQEWRPRLVKSVGSL